MAQVGESWADVEACSHDTATLDAAWIYDAGELTGAAPDLFVWTARHVYAALEEEGFGEVMVVPRQPGNSPPASWTPPPAGQQWGAPPARERGP